MGKFPLGDVSLASDGEHDGKSTVGDAGLEEALVDKVHVGVCFFCEAEAEEDVDCEGCVPDPAEPVVPVADAADVFGDGEGGGGDDGAGGFVGHELQDHEGAGDDFAPAAFVFGLGDPVVPIRLCVVLLGVEDGGGDDLCYVVGEVVPQNEGDGLAWVDVDAGYHAFAEHAFFHDFFELDAGVLVVVVFTPVDGDVELELDVFAVEGDGFAC